MLHYLYGESYEKARAHQTASAKDDMPLLMPSSMVTDQYLIHPLKDSAKNEFERRVEEIRDSERFVHLVQELWDHEGIKLFITSLSKWWRSISSTY